MKKNGVFTRTLIGVLVVLLAAPLGVFAQSYEASQTISSEASQGVSNETSQSVSNETRQTLSKQELDQMLAPIALYPDSLTAQILVAATYPAQVVEADRWVKQNKGLSGDELNAALDKMDWDLSVKALAPFPKVLAMMDEHLDWTTKMGEAFLAQQTDVMTSIQELRAKAYAKGNLQSTEQQKVVVAQEGIEIQPANPEAIYVPYYDPGVVYGDWWWPGYPPFAFYPWGAPYIAFGAFGFLAAVSVGPFWNWGWGSWNWGGGFCNVNINRTVNINRSDPSVTRNMRTANFNQFAGRTGTGVGRTAGAFGAGRTGAAGRPSVASVQRGLSQGRAGVSGGDPTSGTRSAARTGVTSRGTIGSATRSGVASSGTSRAARAGVSSRGTTGSGARTGVASRGSSGAARTGRASRGTANVARGGFSRSSGFARSGGSASGRSFAGGGGFARGGGGFAAARGGGGVHVGGGGGGGHPAGGGARAGGGGARSGGRHG